MMLTAWTLYLTLASGAVHVAYAQGSIGGGGTFSFGSGGGSVPAPVTQQVTSGGSCTAETSIETWEQATNIWWSACVQAIKHACNGEVDEIYKSFDGVADAYAELALEASASCETQGSANGCAVAKGAADAQAQATFDIWVGAVAEASNQGCPCMVEAFTNVYTGADLFGEVWASVWGSVEANVCTQGNESASQQDSLNCYANAFASVWSHAVAGAWVSSSCTEASPDTPVCTSVCDEAARSDEDPPCEECLAEAYATSSAWAEVVIKNELDTYAQCTRTFTDIVDGEAVVDQSQGQNIDGAGASAGGTASTEVFAQCDATADGTSLSSAVSLYVDAFVDAAKRGCKRGHKSITVVIERSAEAVASVWSEVLASCTTNSDNAVGCATAEVFTQAFAEAAAEGIADAWATASIPEECGCQASLSDRAWLTATFHADLFAEIQLWTLADVGCVSGDTTVEKDLYVDCSATAYVGLVSRAVAQALLEGECTFGQRECRQCSRDEECNYEECLRELALKGSAKVEAIVDADVEYNPGYCTGGGFGGEVLDSFLRGVVEINN